MKVVMFVSNPVMHDARVLREADALAEAGHDVVIVGRAKSGTGSALRFRGPVRIVLVPTPPVAMQRWRALRRRPWGLVVELARGAIGALRPGRLAPGRAAALALAAVVVTPWALVRGLVRLVRGLQPAAPSDAFDRIASWRFGLGSWVAAAAATEPSADVWHGHDLSGVLAAERARDRAGGRLVYDSHEVFLEAGSNAALPRWAKAILRRDERRVMPAADALVTVNRAVEADLAATYRVPSLRAVVHNCPPTLDEPDGVSPLRGAIHVGPEVPLALYHGGLSPVRGLRQLLEAMHDPRLAEAHLVFMGSGPLEAELRAAAEDPGYGGRVHVLPPVPPDDLVAWVTGADVGLMPNQPHTRNELVSTPNKLFESLAAGVPVVTSDFPERRRIVLEDPDGPLGAVCDPTDPTDIARAMASLLAVDPARRAEQRARCLRAARMRWNWAAESAKLVALYAELEALGPGAGPRAARATGGDRGEGPGPPGGRDDARAARLRGPETRPASRRALARPIRVLTVARWYPSHDSPGRGSFVADLVAATRALGDGTRVDARVVSFDRVLVRGPNDQRDRLRQEVRAAFDAVATPAALFTRPAALAVPDVDVARLPVVQRPGVDVAALLEDHAEALRPFVRRLLETWRPDVIHAHTGVPDGIVAAQIGRELGIPVLVSEHASTLEAELSNPYTRDRYRTLLGPGVQLLGVSPALAGRMAALLDVPARRIAVLPNPVPVDAFTPAAVTRDPDLLLWVGNLGVHKGIDTLLGAFARARAQRPALRLRLVGGERHAGDLARWRALASAMGVGDAVAFDGWLPRDAVATALREAAVFVHPSPWETFGIVAAEAILAGLPVACLPGSGGVPWIVRLSGGFGAIAAAHGDAPLAEAILRTLDGPLPVDATTARARLVAEVGAAAVARAAVDWYEEAIAEAGAPPVVQVPLADPALPGATADGAAALPRVVAGSSREEALRLVAALPATLQERLTIVAPAAAPPRPAANAATPHAPAVGHAPPAVRARVVDVPATSHRPAPPPVRRLDRLRRRLGRRLRVGRSPRPVDPFGAAIRAAASAGGVHGAVPVVGLDAPAAAAIAALRGDGVRLAPGSTRWLADRWSVAEAATAAGDDADGGPALDLAAGGVIATPTTIPDAEGAA